jgi:protoporphyrinogen oxidase
MTGLAAGMASGFPVYEATEEPGGICSSYYIRPGETERRHRTPPDEEAYRFEIGGGHWIFGGNPVVLQLIQSLTPAKVYSRRSSVYLPNLGLFVPYPIQNHLRHLGTDLAARALKEMVEAAQTAQSTETMAEWLRASFGDTLCDLFFDPFHELYTAGLWRSIAPQDAYKSPVNFGLATEGAFKDVQAVGYNVTFIYPEEGLNTLAQRMASRSDIRFSKRVVRIDAQAKAVHFADGEMARYERLLSTLPLNRMIEMAGLETSDRPNPSPSVLVFNIGAVKGPQCPDDHWVYVPSSKSGFHRVGFYSHVDQSFLPMSSRSQQDRVSIYVERAFPGGERVDSAAAVALGRQIVEELRGWSWISTAEVVDPTWIDVAYTWSWPRSHWRDQALEALERRGIFQVGRYARWIFQGIAESIQDGLLAGAAAAHSAPRVPTGVGVT